MTRYTTLLLLIVLVLSGCRGMRFVIDVVPKSDELTETVVLRDTGTTARSPKVALIDVTGMIADARSPGLISRGENPVAAFAEALRRADEDDRVRAVLVRINSPGGTVTATDIMYNELKRFRETSEKPVVVLMSGVAASGGFYLALAGNEIIAHPTTITGSVGVIMQTYNVSEGLNRIGIRSEAIVSGDKKAAGSPFQPMRPEDRALLQGVVNEFYDNFRTVVITNRTGLADDAMDWITDGRIVTGRQALSVGLVDRLGDLHDAFDRAKHHAGLERARLVKYHREGEHVGSAYSRADMPPSMSGTQINLLQLNMHGGPLFDQPGFYYLWDPVIFGQ
jgi:protease IV